MLKLFVLILITALCNAEEDDYFSQMKELRTSIGNFYDSSSINDGYSNIRSSSNDGYSYDRSSLNSGNYGGIDGIDANVYSKRTVEVRPLNIPYERPQEQVINVPADESPVTVHFRTQGANVRVQQSHTPGGKAEVEHTKSEEEPHRVVHEVLKPIIQEVREIIQPYRKVVQQIQPVIEQVQTVVSKGEPRQRQSSYTSNNRYYSSSPNSYNKDLSYEASDKYLSNGVKYGRGKMSKGLVYSSSNSIFTRQGVPVYRSLYKGNSRESRSSYI